MIETEEMKAAMNAGFKMIEMEQEEYQKLPPEDREKAKELCGRFIEVETHHNPVGLQGIRIAICVHRVMLATLEAFEKDLDEIETEKH